MKAILNFVLFLSILTNANAFLPKACGSCGKGKQWTCHYNEGVGPGTNPFQYACKGITAWTHHVHKKDKCVGGSVDGWTIINNQCEAECTCSGPDCPCDPCYTAGGVCGDPHIKTWNGTWYDFHGECDLVFLHAPNYAKGVGLDIHIRTKIRGSYSYVESAAIQIGEDVLEVSSFGEYSLNGVAGADIIHDSSTFGPAEFFLSLDRPNEKEVNFVIQVGEFEKIHIHTFKDLVAVKLLSPTQANLEGSTGLLGEFETGMTLARDGNSILNDANAFGQEWQVIATEPKLFVTDRLPQQPAQKCIMPEVKAAEKRRLGGTTISKDAAAKACAHHDGTHAELCIFDVMAFGDLELAKSGMY